MPFLLLAACAPLLDRDGDGSPDSEDCQPDDPSAFPGAPELCDGLDTDCDGLLFPGDPDSDPCSDPWYAYLSASPRPEDVDQDGDGFLACLDADDGSTGAGAVDEWIAQWNAADARAPECW